jgi:hypothetical protein
MTEGYIILCPDRHGSQRQKYYYGKMSKHLHNNVKGMDFIASSPLFPLREKHFIA